MRTSPGAQDKHDKGSRQKAIVRIGCYYINAKPRAKGGYSYVYQGWHESDDRIELAFKLLLLHDRKGLLNRSQSRDIDNMVSLMDAMSKRPGATSNHPDLYIDFPFLPLLDIVDVSSSYKNNLHFLKEYDSEKNAEPSLLLVFPFCELDLKTYLKRGSLHSAKEESILRIAHQILRAVGIMHSLGWSHRDLKPENILISKDGQLLLCDFGMARCEVTFLRRFGIGYNYNYKENSYTDRRMPIREYDERCAISYDACGDLYSEQSGVVSRRFLPPAGATSICGTIWWRAPEQSFKKNLNCSGFIGDSWSLGCILIQLLFDYPAFHSKDRDENTGSGEVLAYVNQLRPMAENKEFLETIAANNDSLRTFIDSFKAVTTKINKSRAADLQAIMSLSSESIEDIVRDSTEFGPTNTNFYEPLLKQQHEINDKPHSNVVQAQKHIPPHIRRLVLLNKYALQSPYRDCESLYSTSRYNLKQACFLMLVIRFAPISKIIEMMDRPKMTVQELSILLELSPTTICFYNLYADLVFRLMDPNPLCRIMPTEALTHPIFDSMQNSLFFELDTSNLKLIRSDENHSANNLLHKINIILSRKIDFSKDYLPILLNEISHKILDELVFTHCPSL